jgi:Holliday junction resolvasome RuvABC endonuclease subunit
MSQVPRLFRTRAAASPAVRILGIDPSLTSTGFSYRQPDGTVKTSRVVSDDLRDSWRLSYIRGRMDEILSAYKPTLVVYEDYAMGKGGGRGDSFGRTFHLGELGGVLKLHLWEHGYDVMLVGPGVLKKIIIGKGRVAKGEAKREMVKALKRFDCHVPQHDEADACGLMLVGEIKTGASTIAADLRQSLRLDSLHACEVVRGKLQSIAKPE